MESTRGTDTATANAGATGEKRIQDSGSSGAPGNDTISSTGYLGGFDPPSKSATVARILLWVFMGGVMLLLGISIGLVITTFRGQNVYVQFLRETEDIGQVCPNQSIRQENYMTVDGPAVVLINATIYDDKGQVLYPLVESRELSIDGDAPQPTQIVDALWWDAPPLPTGRYRRVVNAATYRSSTPAWSVTHFEIKECAS